MTRNNFARQQDQAGAAAVAAAVSAAAHGRRDAEPAIGRCVLDIDRAGGVVRLVEAPAAGRLAGVLSPGQSLVDRVHPRDRSFVAANIGWICEEAGRGGRVAFRLAQAAGAGGGAWLPVMGQLRNDGTVVSLTIHIDDIGLARSAEAQMRRLVEGSRQGIVVRTNDQVLYLNDGFAKLVGYHSIDELYALHPSVIDQFIHPDDRSLVAERINARTAGKEAVSSYEIRLMRKGGAPIWVAVTATLIVWDGKPASLSWLTDIDARKSTEAEIRKSKEAAEFANLSKTEFLAHMSHELRTPLNSIIGFSQMIECAPFGPVGSPKYVEYASDIHKSGCHLLDLINDILDLSKIEAGKLELREATIALPPLVEECVSLLRARADKAGVALRCDDMPARLPPLRADARAIRQVLFNLISNAVKFTPAGGAVAVGAQYAAGDGGLALSVVDTGIGMSATEIDIAFAPFGQIDSLLARNHVGTGLGLPLSRSLMRLHGGDIAIASRKGEGTTVLASFPLERVVRAAA